MAPPAPPAPPPFGGPGSAADPVLTPLPGGGLHLESPFSLPSALKFGLLFLAVQVAGTLAEDVLGRAGFYAVAVAGGVVSSASAVASAATLASQGTLGAGVAATGAVLASLASVGVNLVLVARFGGDRALTGRLARTLLVVVLAGVLGGGLQVALGPLLPAVAPLPDTR